MTAKVKKRPTPYFYRVTELTGPAQEEFHAGQILVRRNSRGPVWKEVVFAGLLVPSGLMTAVKVDASEMHPDAVENATKYLEDNR